MALAPPPHGLRMQELGDRLLVCFRPRRHGVVFLCFWLVGWTYGGLGAVAAFAGADTGSRTFLLLWLFGWALGECAVVVILAWMLFGREVLTVSPEVLEVRREVGFFWLARRHDAGLVDGEVAAVLVPTGEDEPPRTDYRLELSCGGSRIRVGEGMSESEAQEVASTVRERLRPPSWWNDENGARPTDTARPTRSELRVIAASMEASTPLRVAVWAAAAAICGGLLVGVAAIVLRPNQATLHYARPAPALAAAPSGGPQPPSAQRYSDPRAYAEAMTRYSLSSGLTVVLSRPRCGDRVTWTGWSCSAMGRSTTPPYAGRTLRYRCHPTSVELQDGRPATSSITCGSER